MSHWNILGILFVVVGVFTLAINISLDVFMGDKIVSSLFALMSSMMIIAGTIMGSIRSQNPNPKPPQLTAVGVFLLDWSLADFPQGSRPRLWPLSSAAKTRHQDFFIITIIDSRLQMGGRWPKPWAKKKREQMLSLLKLNL